jgi:hypothetical protein
MRGNKKKKITADYLLFSQYFMIEKVFLSLLVGNGQFFSAGCPSV